MARTTIIKLFMNSRILSFWWKSKLFVAFCSVISVALLIINISGFAFTLRSPAVAEGMEKFPGFDKLTYAEAMRQLNKLDKSKKDKYVVEVNKIVNKTILHVRYFLGREKKDKQENIVKTYHARVPIWENYILYILSYIKPDTYRDYEFCNYRKTLQRGIGRCGQQSLALVGLLHEQGFETGFVGWFGHTTATVKVADDRWYILDPDFGLAIPYQLEGSERYPERYPRVIEAFFKEYPDKKIVVSEDGEIRLRPDQLYKVGGNRVEYGGPEIRWGRACPIERAAYILKWVLPFLLFLPLALYLLLLSGRVGRASNA